ncbi:uncharacterized protein LOC132707691 isoform X1 [Cylas formicarius]|uniref:uncharacterized protein LOC132707691 isoform X1 n=1 Tax=Cylas formicarius TaxID=197179 RepID=UPI002958A745|nr:uncharacterized protein LOC132707691 isoform X1 [Cylas formicarius]
MSYKSANGVKLSKCDSKQWKTSSTTTILESSVKFAGEEAKDRLYEPKHKKKLVRVLTVVAYVFFVSLAAIMLSLYYMFLWHGDAKPKPSERGSFNHKRCDEIIAEMQQQLNLLKAQRWNISTSPPQIEENITWLDYSETPAEIQRSSFLKKLQTQYFSKRNL